MHSITGFPIYFPANPFRKTLFTSGMIQYNTMNALINAHSNVGGEPTDSPLSDGLTSNAIPEAERSQTGVSVNYAQLSARSMPLGRNAPFQYIDGKPHWFVLRVSYGRATKASDLLRQYGITTFNPLHAVMKRVKGKLCRVQLPLLPGLIFAHTEAPPLYTVMQEPAVRALCSYYYDHFHQIAEGYNPPLVVPDKPMESFITALTADSHDVRVVTPEYVHYKSGDIVRVIAGQFKGVEGRVARAAGQQRVIINITGLCLIATAYVPTGCLEIVTPAESGSQ